LTTYRDFYTNRKGDYMSIMDEYREKARKTYPKGQVPMRVMMSDAVHSKDMSGIFGKKKGKNEEEEDDKKKKKAKKKKS